MARRGDDIEDALKDLARHQPPERGEVFWHGFTRNVRSAYLAARGRRAWWRRVVPVGVGLALAAAALALWVRRDTPPVPVTVDHAEAIDDTDPYELIEAIDAEGLQKIAAALGKEKT